MILNQNSDIRWPNKAIWKSINLHNLKRNHGFDNAEKKTLFGENKNYSLHFLNNFFTLHFRNSFAMKCNNQFF